MDNTIPRTTQIRERTVKWGNCYFNIREIFHDGPEEREKQKRALEILRDAPVPVKKREGI